MKEEMSRLLIEHMHVNGGQLDAIRPQRTNNLIHLIARYDKVACNCGSPTAGRLEIDCGSQSQRTGGAKRHSVFGHRIGAWHSKLINAAVWLTFDPDDFIEACCVEINGRWWSGCGRRRQRCLAGRQCVVNSACHFGRIPMPANMHIESRWGRAQQVVVDCRYLNPAGGQLGHHWIDVGFEEQETTQDDDDAIRRFECHPTSKGQCRFDGDADERYGEVSAGKTITVNVTRDGGLSAKRRINLLPI